jgi:hypothetical protein
MRTLILLLAVAFITVGCGTVKKLTDAGVNVVASVGTNVLGLVDFSTPLVQDPAQPGDTNAVIVNPAIVSAAQGAATTFGGPYGLPVAAGIGVIAGIAGVMATQRQKRS